MNAAQDMALYLQMMTANAMQRNTTQKAVDRERPGDSFKNLMDQKRRAEDAEQKTQGGQKAEDRPVGTTGATTKDETDLERLQLQAAAQAAAAVTVVQTVDLATVPMVENTGAVQTVAADQLQTRVDTQLGAAAGSRPVLAETEGQLQTGAAVTDGEGAEQTQQVRPQANAPVVQTQTGNQTRESRPEVTDQPIIVMHKDDELLNQVKAGGEQVVFEQVEAVPVKVGEAPVVDTQSGDMEVQLAKQVDRLVETGGEKVELRLSPENLGTVTVQLTRSQDGSLHVVLQAADSRAAELLERHASGLENILAGGNRNTVEVEVQRQQESPQSQNQHLPFDKDGNSGQRQQRQQQQQQQQTHGQDFMQQLRLGLFPLVSDVI